MIWDAETGALIGEPLKGHKASITSVCFSPDDKTVVTGSNDKTAIIWDVNTGL